MKKLFISAGLVACSLIAVAQESATCYQKYTKVFEVRGADAVEDGTYDDVIITIRKGRFADCFLGKVTVKNGEILKNSIQLSYVDNSYENLVRSYKSDEPVTIIEGISKTLLTDDEELINVMFVSVIKPKKKALKRAPEPSFDL
ncbi:hypothetical protein N9J85_00750 [bacterium]|nr:hypothetical protein [bacterium]